MKQKNIYPCVLISGNFLHTFSILTSNYSTLASKTLHINDKSLNLKMLRMKINKNSLGSCVTATEKNEKPNNNLPYDTYINVVNKLRHSPPSNKEWINSTYVYNNTSKNLPVLDNMLSRLVRTYFNLYNNKLRKKIRKHGSRRFEIRKSRRLMKKIFIGKPELKHSNNNIVITVYVYNAEKNYLINKIIKIPAIYKVKTLNRYKTLKYKMKLKIKKINVRKTLYLNKTKKSSIYIMSKLNSYKKITILKKTSTKKKININYEKYFNINKYEKHFLKVYIRKLLRKEVISNFYKQMLIFNKQKFEKRYVMHLANNIAKIYKKKIEFNFVNLKHIYLDSQIFSIGLVTKLKRLAKKKKSFLRGLKRFLNMFKIPRINSLHTYNEIFNRQTVNQSINNNNIIATANYIDIIQNGYVNNDTIDNTLKHQKYVTTNISEFKSLISARYISTYTQAFNLVKYKIINGIRLEIAGRFTKRSSAARSVFKIRNKGSIKNRDSSYKGLPAVLLKGYAKSNLQYNKVYSKVRGGSFGIKGWLSGA